MPNTNIIRFPEFTHSWEYKRLGEYVVEMLGGASLTPNDILEEGDYKIIPKKSIQAGGKIVIDDDCTWVTTEVFNKYPKSQIDKSYLLVVLRDLVPTGPSIGYVVENDKVDNGILAQGVYGLKLSKELYGKYLIQYSNTPQYRKLMQTIMVGSTQVHIRNTIYLDINIPFTCIEEQKKIADFLSAVDDVIAISEKEIENLEEQKKGVMQKIFSKEVRFTADDGSDYSVWNIDKLEEYVDVYDGTHQTPKYVENGIKFVSVEDINDLYSTDKFITEEAYEKDFSVVPEKNDVLMTRIGNVGKPALVTSDEKIAFYVSLALLKCKKINPEYLYHYIKSEPFQNELWKKMLHIAFPMKINKGDIGQCMIQVPCLEEQQKIADFLSDFDTAIEKAKAELECWKEIKKGLLQQLFE